LGRAAPHPTLRATFSPLGRRGYAATSRFPLLPSGRRCPVGRMRGPAKPVFSTTPMRTSSVPASDDRVQALAIGLAEWVLREECAVWPLIRPFGPPPRKRGEGDMPRPLRSPRTPHGACPLSPFLRGVQRTGRDEWREPDIRFLNRAQATHHSRSCTTPMISPLRDTLTRRSSPSRHALIRYRSPTSFTSLTR
jgi:hypothetical protein